MAPERSVEHAFLTPVFGTSRPPAGLSGAIRTHAYRRYSEAQAAHGLLLIVADRVNSVEASVSALMSGHPDNPVTETGVLSEIFHHRLASRLGQKRADVKHQVLDPIIVAGPQALRGFLVYSVGKAAVRRVRRALR